MVKLNGDLLEDVLVVIQGAVFGTFFVRLGVGGGVRLYVGMVIAADVCMERG